MTEKNITLSSVELEDIIDRCVDRGVKKSLGSLGVDVENPLEMQRDFQHLRDWRNSIKMIRNRGLLAVIGVLVTGLVGLVVTGFTIWVKGL